MFKMQIYSNLYAYETDTTKYIYYGIQIYPLLVRKKCLAQLCTRKQ